ncbi:MAG: aminoacetone oxidase family FAD-binding enzyme, partial [Planctomycetota bacterium]
RAARRGRRVVLLEKNRKAGVKILMSGGTRCNLTQATDRRGIADAFGKQGRFLHSPLAALGPDEVVELFAAEGVATKVESTGKVFPVSNRALDVQRAMLRMLEKTGAELRLDEPVTAIAPPSGAAGSGGAGGRFLITTSRGQYAARSVVITSGGQSYPGCGTTGDGYAWSKRLGHRIVPPRPALAPMLSPAGWLQKLRGVTLPDAGMALGVAGGKPVDRGRGSLLLTHFGVSGPLAMNLSHVVTARPDAERWEAVCDFTPGVEEEALHRRLGGESEDAARPVGAVAETLAPRRLAESLLALAETPPERRVAELSKRQRRRVVDAFKRCRVPITGTQGFKKAEVTAGGVDLRDVDSRTMQSRRTPGLFFAGEVLDLDGPIGGYNFQAAFSTGWLAGENA